MSLGHLSKIQCTLDLLLSLRNGAPNQSTELLKATAFSLALSIVSYNIPVGIVIPILQMKQPRLQGPERCGIFSKVK